VNTLFFVLLLSLLIALFDRFRAARRTMATEPHVVASFRDQWARRRARRRATTEEGACTT
jgi:hypothetical protein